MNFVTQFGFFCSKFSGPRDLFRSAPMLCTPRLMVIALYFKRSGRCRSKSYAQSENSEFHWLFDVWICSLNPHKHNACSSTSSFKENPKYHNTQFQYQTPGYVMGQATTITCTWLICSAIAFSCLFISIRWPRRTRSPFLLLDCSSLDITPTVSSWSLFFRKNKYKFKSQVTERVIMLVWFISAQAWLVHALEQRWEQEPQFETTLV